MSCNSNNIHDFLNKYEHRKTVPKDEAIAMIREMVERCTHPLHLPPCSAPRDELAVLPNQYIEENRRIQKINDRIQMILDEIPKS